MFIDNLACFGYSRGITVAYCRIVNYWSLIFDHSSPSFRLVSRCARSRSTAYPFASTTRSHSSVVPPTETENDLWSLISELWSTPYRTPPPPSRLSPLDLLPYRTLHWFIVLDVIAIDAFVVAWSLVFDLWSLVLYAFFHHLSLCSFHGFRCPHLSLRLQLWIKSVWNRINKLILIVDLWTLPIDRA